MAKIIQIQKFTNPRGAKYLVALRDDGSLWRTSYLTSEPHWERVALPEEPTPQPPHAESPKPEAPRFDSDEIPF